ncbi:hypothetical protein TcBrA4_0041830 [Trypanosoma cruzi]|nr:hypothetical protein TcBrA4_0041830 [Trypanosoma cruzi]
MAIRDADLSLPGRSVTLCDEPLYLTLFDNSVMVFNEGRRLVTGIPAIHIKSLHYSTMEVDASKKDPKNEKCRCFLSFRSSSEEYPDILFVPTLERFADANEGEHSCRAGQPRANSPLQAGTYEAADSPDG